MEKNYSDSSNPKESNDLLILQGQIIDALNCGILAYTIPDHTVIAVNDSIKHIYGISGADSNTLGRAIIYSVVPEDQEYVKKLTSSLQKNGDSVNYHFRIQKPSGEIAMLKGFTTIRSFSDGRQYVLSVIEDITEQERLRVSLNREKQMYREALTHGADCCFTFDVTEGLITEPVLMHDRDIFQDLGLSLPVHYDEFNSRFFQEYDVQLTDESMKDCFCCEGLEELYNKGLYFSGADYYIPHTDTYYSYLTAMSRDEKNGHLYALCFSRDTTEQRAKEIAQQEALQDAYDAANRANDAKTKFLSSMSHDIRTPMNAIIGMTAIAGTHLEDRDRVADCLAKITTSSKHLLGLINEVLDMNKIESGKLDLCMEEFNLSDLVDNILIMIRPQINACHHELIVNTRNVEHELVVGDSQRIQQIFMNILGNAVKYTPEYGRIELSINEKPTDHTSVGCYEFIFQDNGIGMDEKFVPHIFDAFSRAKNSSVENIQGTGLGMAITNNIVHMMNGDIKVESKLGEGSKFTVTIYLERQSVDESLTYDQFVDLPVLVVDDDEYSCETTCGIICNLGMKGEWVLSGREAIDLIEQRHKDNNDFVAVIIDWKMPDMDGITTSKEIRRRFGSDIPIIIISAYDWSDIEAEARTAGVNAFLSKPVFKSRIVHTFRSLLSNEKESSSRFDLQNFSQTDFSGKRVLLVEDNAMNAEIAGEILSMTGLEVRYACNGREAVDLITEAEDGYYDMVFMDIQMPVMNGYEATRAIRSLPRDHAKRIPIFAMTANAFAEDIEEAKNAGMTGHIAKPLNFKELHDALDHWLI